MKLYYFNDRKTKARVCVGTLVYTSRVLSPAEGAVFEVEIPEGSSPFIKVYDDGSVLLAAVPEEMMHTNPQKVTK